jgi:hypothetical protein
MVRYRERRERGRGRRIGMNPLNKNVEYDKDSVHEVLKYVRCFKKDKKIKNINKIIKRYTSHHGPPPRE